MQKRQSSTSATLLMSVRFGSNVCPPLQRDLSKTSNTKNQHGVLNSTVSNLWSPADLLIMQQRHSLATCHSSLLLYPNEGFIIRWVFFFLLDDEQGSCCIPECDVFTSKDFWRHLSVWKLLTLLCCWRLIEMTRMLYNLLPFLFFRKKWIEFLSESMQSRVTGQKYYRYFALCLWNILQRIVILNTCYHQNVFYVCIYVYIFESVYFPHSAQFYKLSVVETGQSVREHHVWMLENCCNLDSSHQLSTLMSDFVFVFSKRS